MLSLKGGHLNKVALKKQKHTQERSFVQKAVTFSVQRALMSESADIRHIIAIEINVADVAVI